MSTRSFGLAAPAAFFFLVGLRFFGDSTDGAKRSGTSVVCAQAAVSAREVARWQWRHKGRTDRYEYTTHA